MQRTFLQNESTCVSWGSHLLHRSSCTVCKQKASLHYEPACGFSGEKHWCLSSRTGCSCGSSFHHADACEFWSLLPFWRRDCTEHMSKVRLQFGFPLDFFCSAWVSWSVKKQCWGIAEDSKNHFQVETVFEKVKVMEWNWNGEKKYGLIMLLKTNCMSRDKS